MMQIRSGIWKGRKIQTPSHGTIRPTSDKVRQALFNYLRPRIRQSNFLDLFCGSGAVGLTALSEGADHVSFVEKDQANILLLKNNIKTVAQGNQYVIYKKDVKKAIISMNTESFDVIFADPFYKDSYSFIETSYTIIISLLKQEGLFVLEHSNKKKEILFYNTLSHYIETKTYGSTAISIFQVVST